MFRTAAVLIALGFAAAFSAPAALAQVSKEQIINQLKPTKPATRSLRVRQIEIVPGKEAQILDNKELPKINLTIEFEYDSDRPTPAGEKQLVQLGQALADPNLNGFRYLVAGHTDARGSEDYNQRLSERRAIAVQHFLGQFKVPQDHISVVGFGETRPLGSVSPDDPRNRRVEIVNVLK
jgi:outer membrane protein OmpA-like peptidoglycan-associated protein